MKQSKRSFFIRIYKNIHPKKYLDLILLIAGIITSLNADFFYLGYLMILSFFIIASFKFNKIKKIIFIIENGNKIFATVYEVNDTGFYLDAEYSGEEDFKMMLEIKFHYKVSDKTYFNEFYFNDKSYNLKGKEIEIYHLQENPEIIFVPLNYNMENESFF